MSRKHPIWNTIEQYTGLKLSAASLFSEKTFSFLRKRQNRSFSAFEQYAGLESTRAQNLTVLGAVGRGSEALGSIAAQGYQGPPGM